MISGFGSAVSNLLGGPNYTAPDPNASPLDQSADLLQQRVKRANQVATSPFAAIFAPEQVQAARDFVPKATEQLQQIQKQKADIAAGRRQAATLGLDPGEVSDQATKEDRITAAQARALKGDLKAFQGLQAVDPKAAEAIQDQVHSAIAANLDAAQGGFDKLANARNPGQYEAALRELRQKGDIAGLESLGLKVPERIDQFNAFKGREAEALRNARIGVDTMRQRLEDRNTYQPMEEKEAKTYAGRLTTAYGDQITNGTWSRNSAAGTRGLVVNGAADPRDLGKNYTLATPEQRKAVGEEFNSVVPKEDMEKFRAFNRISDIATRDSKGDFIPAEGRKNAKGETLFLNTNPNVQQGVSEGLAFMMRGGLGGANGQLMKLELAKRGWAQGAIDGFFSNYAGAINTMFRDANAEGKPYLSQRTQKQIRDVIDALHAAEKFEIGDRVSPVAKRAGALGLDSAAIGFGKSESTGVIADAMEEGRQAQIARMLPYHQAIGGGDGVFQPGAQRPGAGATGVPAGTQLTTQLPGAPPLQTPVQQATNPPSPRTPGGGNPPDGQGSEGGQKLPAGPAPPGGPAPVAPPTGGNPPQSAGIPQNFADEIKKSEGFEGRAKWDYKQFTNGYGTRAAHSAEIIDKETAERRFNGEMSKAASVVDAVNPNLDPGTRAALASLTFNAGDAWTKSGLGDKIRAGDIRGAKAAFLQYNKAGGETNQGLAARRNRESRWFGQGGTEDITTATGPAGAAYGGMRLGTHPRDVAADNTTWGDVGRGAIEHAPAIGSTIGAGAGTLIEPGVGTIAGGGVGGAAGQSLKDWLLGNTQNPVEIAKQGALGAVLGVAPEGRPAVGALTRTLGPAAIEGGAKAAEGGDTEDVVTAAGKGLAYGLGGEALARFVSSAGAAAYKALSRYTRPAQHELSAAAGKLTEARKALETEQPKLPGDAGANPKYEAAKKQADEATAAIKDHGQNPDDMVHAYEQAKAGVSGGEAAVLRKAASEQRSVGQGYDELRQNMQQAGVGVPKPDQPVPDGPVAQIRTAENPRGAAEEKFRPDAEHAEMLIKAPAKDWGEKWQQLQNAGSELVKKRMAFLQNGDKPSAEAMDAIFEGVRNQQKAAAAYVFGKEGGEKAVAQLENLDKRYAKLMNATAGMDYGKMRSIIQSGNTPARRELERNFREFAGTDPGAMRAFAAMKAGAQGRLTEETKLLIPLMVGEAAGTVSGVMPTFGAATVAVTGHRLYKIMQEYANAKVLGKAVKFADFLHSEARRPVAHGTAGSAVQRAVVQEQPTFGMMQ
jgi:GH24 family phage-related lysozyme (muramidase)